MFCPACGAEISKEDKFCSKCGHKIDDEIVQNNTSDEGQPIKKSVIFTSVLLFIFVITCCAYAYLKKVGSTINLDDANVPEVMPKAENCMSPYVENEVLKRQVLIINLSIQNQ